VLLLFLATAYAEGAQHSRARASSNGEYSVIMRTEASGKCRVEVSRDTDPAWTLPRCVGSVDDLYFISDSGERFWVLAALPKSKPSPQKPAPVGEAQTRAARKVRSPDVYSSVVVAVLYDRLGNTLGERKLSELLSPESFRKVRTLDRRFVWLEGVSGVPGREPRVTDKNEVEFDTVEPRTLRLGFE
jgi:hypothetical protein